MATANAFLSHGGTVSVRSFAGMCVFSLTLRLSSVNDVAFVSVLLFLWCGVAALDSIDFGGINLSFRWRYS